MKTIRTKKAIFLSATLIIIFCLIAAPAMAAKKPIKIGVIGMATGMGYLTWKPFYDGLVMTVDEINANGGILGRPVKLVVRDDELKVDLAIRGLKDLILRERVDFLLQCSSSGIGLAETEVVKQYKIPIIYCAANTQRLTEDKGHRYAFLIQPNTRIEASAIAIFTKKNGWKKIWTVMPDYEWGHTVQKFYIEKLKNLVPDAEIVGESWPKIGETDMTPYISAIMAAKPDFVMGGLWGADLINFTKQAKPYGYFDKVVSSGVYDLNQLRALGNEMVEGAVSWNRGEFFSVNTPAMADFVKKFQEAYDGEYPTAYANFAHESLYAIKKAMEIAGTTDKEKVTDAMTGLSFSGPRGELQFRACDNQANAPEYVGFTVKDPKYPFYVLRDVLVVKAEDAWLSCDEISKARGN